MKSFCVSRDGNTAQDIQDLLDLAVWAGADAFESISKTRKNIIFNGYNSYLYVFWSFFGVTGSGRTFVSDNSEDISDNLITYEQAIDHILNGE